jgi:tetratricopeptide (TPR) repeat protein
VDASVQEIGDRYKDIARRLHPDSSHWQTAADKQLAVQIFSKLVTHAYGKLSRTATREEDRIVLELIAKRMVSDVNELKITDPLAQELYQSGNDFDRIYADILGRLVAKQYHELTNVVEIINQISEVNQVYLVRKQLQTVRSSPPTATAANSVPEPRPAKTGATSGSLEQKASTIDGSIRRAEEYISMKNWSKAILELRDANNIEPKNSSVQALLGIAYLRQNQLTMAKVSIEQALKYNPQDPRAIQAKKELDKSMNNTVNKAAPKKSESTGKLFGLFGKK